ncbi:helix-turn-helix domain-containing protein, partial [Candidatus Latescibacterota bacterium]
MTPQKPNKLSSGKILTTGAIAHYCETTVKQVNRWIKSGKLTAFQTPGGHYRVSKDEFRKFLER